MTAANEWAMIVGTCPRCGHHKVTLDVKSDHPVGGDEFETFVRCRQCYRTSVLLLYNTRSDSSPNSYPGNYITPVFEVRGTVIAIPDATQAPEYTPLEVGSIFNEASRCLAMSCYDASGTMFRKVLDAATRSLLPEQPDGKDHPDYIPWKVRKDVALRLIWLFDNGRLPEGLRELASCVREDGNDAAHDLRGIEEAEARDLEDFTVVVLETLYTLPGQIEANKARRTARRAGLDT